MNSHANIQFDIFPCSAAEAAAVAKLDTAMWADWGLPITFYRQLLEVSPESLLVAKIPSGRIAGYAVGLVKSFDTAGYIFSVDVDPEFRRLGIGRALIERLCLYFQARGSREIAAMIEQNNIPSQGLFEGFGFVRGELIEGYFGPGHDYYRFVRPL